MKRLWFVLILGIFLALQGCVATYGYRPYRAYPAYGYYGGGYRPYGYYGPHTYRPLPYPYYTAPRWGWHGGWGRWRGAPGWRGPAFRGGHHWH